jgi:hypothetical protein
MLIVVLLVPTSTGMLSVEYLDYPTDTNAETPPSLDEDSPPHTDTAPDKPLAKSPPLNNHRLFTPPIICLRDQPETVTNQTIGSAPTDRIETAPIQLLVLLYSQGRSITGSNNEFADVPPRQLKSKWIIVHAAEPFFTGNSPQSIIPTPIWTSRLLPTQAVLATITACPSAQTVDPSPWTANRRKARVPITTRTHFAICSKQAKTNQLFARVSVPNLCLQRAHGTKLTLVEVWNNEGTKCKNNTERARRGHPCCHAVLRWRKSAARIGSCHLVCDSAISSEGHFARHSR